MGEAYLLVLDALALVAGAHGETGQVEDGLRVVVEALVRAETTREGLCEAEVYRLKGKLLLQQVLPDAPKAERCFRPLWPLPAASRRNP
jgi:hypothetical protein